MRGKITIKSVKALKPGEIISDTNPTGFVARCQPSGKVSFFYRYRDKRTGKKHWVGLGVFGDITADRARELAQGHAGSVAGKVNPLEEARKERAEAAKTEKAEKNTVNSVLDAFEAEHVKTLRSADQIKSAFKNHVRPRIGAKSIYDLTRADITTMLKEIRKSSGPVAADRVLAFVRKAFAWQMIEDEEFTSPVIRGMATVKPKERARTRVLDDDEIRDLWAALDTADVPPCYVPFIKSLLLCATRRNESADMHASELDGGVWTIPAARYKGNHDHTIPLSSRARALLGESKGFLFSTTDGQRPFSGFSKAKVDLDKAIAKVRKGAGRGKMPRWTLHDLRRTARSLMSRAGVDSDIAERCLGHVIGGVRETYDRWSYADEKRQAFESLAGLVERILNPQTGNVVQLRGSTDI